MWMWPLPLLGTGALGYAVFQPFDTKGKIWKYNPLWYRNPVLVRKIWFGGAIYLLTVGMENDTVKKENARRVSESFRRGNERQQWEKAG